MRFLTRYLSSLVRSRRRVSFSLLVSLLILIAVVLYIINNKHYKIPFLSNHNEEPTTVTRSFIGTKSILLNKLTEKTTTTIEQ